MIPLVRPRGLLLLTATLGLAALVTKLSAGVPVPYETKVSLDAPTSTISTIYPVNEPSQVVIDSTVAPITRNGHKKEGKGVSVFKSTQGGVSAFALKCDPGTGEKDRSEIELQSFSYSKSRYTAFNIYVPGGANPTGWLIFAQWWRSGPDLGGNMSPPVSLELEPNTTNMLVGIRNQANKNGLGGITVNGAKYYARAAFPRNTWIKVEAWTRFEVDTRTDSRLVVFITPQGGTRTRVVDYRGSIGYAQPVTGSFYHKVGNYRKASANAFTIYLDDIKTDQFTFN